MTARAFSRTPRASDGGRSAGIRSRPVRRGVTLIELMVVMTGVAAMLGLCVLMLQLLMRLDVDSRARFDGAVALARLAQQFRFDVQGATAARLADQPAAKPARLRIEDGPAQTIEYEAEGAGKLVRVESKQGNVVRRETYVVSRSEPIKLQIKEIDGRRFASLIVDRRNSKNRTDPSRPYEILALLGKNKGPVATGTKAGGEKP